MLVDAPGEAVVPRSTDTPVRVASAHWPMIQSDGVQVRGVAPGQPAGVIDAVCQPMPGQWRIALVQHRDRHPVVVEYSVADGPLGQRHQRIDIDRVRTLAVN
ncbi:hypothetical protein [Pseudonocardia sp. GCM10023141]|uniref:hypothetical protein n=1 Tax=Pseudonocardia sp. GCM10023141 TaxID=3252653 RepID=UPI0036107601